jgi:predicted MPP superfamily phosphohydrolase
MTTLLQISDPHFGTEQPPVLQALHELATEVRPNLVVLSGDITQRARRAQFAAARRFIDGLAPRALIAIPGNHDIPLFNLAARLAAPYGNYRSAFGPALESDHETDELLVLALNSTRPWRHKHGELSAAQVQRVSRRLRAAAPAQLRVVVLHHPVWALRASDEANLVRGHREAIAAWTAAGLDIVLGGHIHLPYLHALPAVAGRCPAWAVQAGTAVSGRVRDGIPNSVNLLRCGGGMLPRRCVVERWDFVAASGRFARISETRLRFGDEAAAPAAPGAAPEQGTAFAEGAHRDFQESLR